MTTEIELHVAEDDDPIELRSVEVVRSGGGGTTDYDELENKPSINGVTLEGDSSASDLSLASASDLAAKYTKPSSGIPKTDLAPALSSEITQNTEDVDDLKSAITYVTPEMFGAKGDGATDDTAAFLSMFNSGETTFVLTGNYLLSPINGVNSIKGTNLTILGNGGKITLHNVSTETDGVEALKFESSDGLTIKNLTIDANHMPVRALCLYDCENWEIDKLTIVDVGIRDQYNNVTGVFIRDNSNHGVLSNLHIDGVSSSSMSSGVWIAPAANDDSGSTLPCDILIEKPYISDIYPITDSDGIKIISGTSAGKDAYLTVSNGYFLNCRKRALKFQAPKCFSFNNTMVWSERGFCPIDFQRGFCESKNDKIITTWAGDGSDISYGYFYSYVSIRGDNSKVTNLSITCPTDSSWISSNANGALVVLGAFSDLTSCRNNVIEGIHGNAVAGSLFRALFEGENGASSNTGEIVGNKFTDIEFFACKPSRLFFDTTGFFSFINNEVEAVSKSTEALLLASKVNVNTNIFRIAVPNSYINAGMTSSINTFFSANGFSSIDKYLSSRTGERIRKRTRADIKIWFGQSASLPTTQTGTYALMYAHAKIGDMALFSTPTFADSKLQLGYICTQSASGTANDGVWSPLYASI